MKSRNWLIVGVVVVVAIFGYRWFSTSSASQAQGAINENVEVISLEVAETVEASGTLQAQPYASLTWKTNGIVEMVNVQAGDMVKAGDVLLALQPSSTSANIVGAQADLIKAQEKLDDLLLSGTALAQAEIDLKEAKEAYDKAEYYLKYLNNDTNVPQTLYTAKLVQTRNGWEYEYETNNFKGPAPKEWIVDAENDLALKKAKLEDAQRTYDDLLAGKDSPDVAAARAELDAAQANVNSLYIIAPFDGQVLWVENIVGDLVDTNKVSVYIADMNHLYVDAQVDESDVAKVRVGNQVEVTLDAVDGVTLIGEVAVVNPVGESSAGLVKYSVRIVLDAIDSDVLLPIGATADAVIQVKEPTSALGVPLAAMQNDDEGEFVWLVQSDGSAVRVSVLSGEIVDDYVVVTGALQAGDVLQTVHANSVPARGPFAGDE